MKRVKLISIVVCLLAVLFVVNGANAELFNRGTDSLGNQLIYDSDLNITWYDYTSSPNTWAWQMNLWVANLDVDFGGNHYTDWRLPITFDQSCMGYNCTNSEMGHLYYTELGNTPAVLMTNTGDFQNLQEGGNYWSGTVYAADPERNIIIFGLNKGIQKDADYINDLWAIAVRDGDVAAIVPEPISSILFLTGGGVLAGRRYWKKRNS